MPTLILKDPRFWTAMVAFSLGAWLLVPQMIGERPPVVRAEDIPDATYICRESKDALCIGCEGTVSDVLCNWSQRGNLSPTSAPGS